MVLLANLEGSAALVAVTVTDREESTEGGAVYSPLVKLPSEGLMDQVTEVFELPVTLPANCTLCAGARVAFGGVMPTLTLGGWS